MTELELEAANERFLTRYAEYEVNRYVTGIRLADEQHMSAFRWLYASLLAVNGALALAVLNANSVSGSWKLLPLGLAFAGICAALLIARLAQVASDAPMKATNELVGYWASVAEYKLRMPEKEAELGRALTAANQPSKWVARMGWVAATCFALSAFSLGGAIYFQPAPACNGNESPSMADSK